LEKEESDKMKNIVLEYCNEKDIKMLKSIEEIENILKQITDNSNNEK